MFKKILIIADIEGSSGCMSYNASSFNTDEWYDACIDMSLDVRSVTEALFNAGAEQVVIKDFHRTGYNILPEFMDRRARLVSGYKRAPVPGIGQVFGCEAVIFTGMHSSSGSSGFLAHTLTSRHGHIKANGVPVSEIQIFASSLYSHNVKPVFFSGCPEACREAVSSVPGITVYEIDKSAPLEDKVSWRSGLARAAAASLENMNTAAYLMKTPCDVEVKVRDGDSAAGKIAERWGLDRKGDLLFFRAETFDDFYEMMIRISYLTPFMERLLPWLLPLFNLFGKFGLAVLRRKRKKEIEYYTRILPE
ncbi:MAG TPA: M55 family metallopeptidase [Spirochaetota bacterium]|nr:M55 family metallopeptidase [Spirochaetota bacterium]HPJ34651.1 M55 family metallopeptidase [Spirochaetota bacterium]